MPSPKPLDSTNLTVLPSSSSQVTVRKTHSRRRCGPSRSRFHLANPHRLKNNLLAGVGYLELANAGDFAANVWNQIPVPIYALVLMAIGGVLALCMAGVAIWDFRRAWSNTRLLLRERRDLVRIREDCVGNAKIARILDARLGVSFREIGSEVVDRVIMDAVMGFGSILVGTGTIMAIWGKHPSVFLASNLLSGYVGNSMAAVFGLSNALWSAYLFLRFHRLESVTRGNDAVSGFQPRMGVRFRRFQGHAVVNIFNGLVSGAASMVTATMWWGYVVLAPCIVSLIACNYYWRWKLGYDRGILSESCHTGFIALDEELEHVVHIHGLALQSGFSAVVDTSSLAEVVRFIEDNEMFEGFVEWLVRDHAIWDIFVWDEDVLTICPDDLLNSDLKGLLLDKATRFLDEAGLLTFVYKERYLLELVAYSVWLDSLANRPTAT